MLVAPVNIRIFLFFSFLCSYEVSLGQNAPNEIDEEKFRTAQPPGERHYAIIDERKEVTFAELGAYYVRGGRE